MLFTEEEALHARGGRRNDTPQISLSGLLIGHGHLPLPPIHTHRKQKK